jgi:hypothetical protein
MRHTTWSQSQPLFIVLLHSSPRFAKSAERIEGAIIAAGAMLKFRGGEIRGSNGPMEEGSGFGGAVMDAGTSLVDIL